MSSKRNYFRHEFSSRNNPFIVLLMEKFGYQGYFLWFSLIEMCAEIAITQKSDTFIISKSMLMRSLRCKQDKLDLFLAISQKELRISYEKAEDKLRIHIPNMPKYLGFRGVRKSQEGVSKSDKLQPKKNLYKPKKEPFRFILGETF